MTTYLRFTEINDWEGEEWNFYLPIEGNESALEHLRTLIEGNPDTYEIDDYPYPGAVVDHITKRSRSGYMNYENRVEGFLQLPDSIDDWVDNDPFYKGGIRKFFHPDKS